tara:strand:- start:789 stop:1070 length:282 start_codon:yes stop_codon:yes gene_type:complete
MKILLYGLLGFVLGAPMYLGIEMLTSIHALGKLHLAFVLIIGFLFLLVAGLTVWVLRGCGEGKIGLAHLLALVTGAALSFGVGTWFFAAFPLT